MQLGEVTSYVRLLPKDTRYIKGIRLKVFSIMLGKLEVDDIFSLIQIQQTHLRSVWHLTAKNANQPSHVSKNFCKSTNASALEVVNLMDKKRQVEVLPVSRIWRSEGPQRVAVMEDSVSWFTFWVENLWKKQLVGGLERRGMKEANSRIPNHNDHNVDGTAIQFLAA